MKAAIIRKYGPSSVFEITETGVPVPYSEEVQIQVMASSVNPVDWKTRSGSIAFLSGFSFPRILGADFSGIVLTCGSQVNRVKPGDEVFGFSSAIFSAGAYAEIMCCKADRLVIKPQTLNHVQAAVVPLAASTAYQALYNQGKIKSGMRVLITGATGGVGHFAVQLAKQAGCHVTGVCHSANTKLALQLGCNEVLPYDTQPFLKTTGVYDLIFDAAGKFSFFECRRKLKKSGRMVSTLPFFSVMLSHAASFFSPWRKGKFIPVSAVEKDLQFLADACDSGALVPHIERIFPLEEIAQAHALSETEKVRGKIAIRIV